MLKKNILVSVIVPVYNVELFLQECIESLINQTYRNIEIILVDDGSTDKSGQICDDYENRDRRIRTVHKQNGGLSSARNAGIEVMQGKYCTFVDSDDVIAVSYIEDMLETALNTDADIVAGLFSRDINKLGLSEGNELIYADAHKALEFIFSEKTMTTSACNRLFRTELWSDIRFPAGIIFEDYATIYKVLLLCNRVVIIPKILYFYRENSDSITGQRFSAARLQYFDITEEIEEEIAKVYPDLLTFIDNRTVRYAISFFRQISKSGYYDQNAINLLRGRIRTGIVKYLRTDYSYLSKAYGLLIVISPGLAFRLFSNN